MFKISIAKDFTKTPGGRYAIEGPFSGEEFRKNILEPKYIQAISSNQKLVIDLDGCFGYPSSFIDESFGGLARELNDPSILDKIEFISNDQPSLVEFIKLCVKNVKENNHETH